MEVAIWVPGLRSETPAGFILPLAWSGPISALIAAWRALENTKRAAWAGVACAATCLGLWLTSCGLGDDRSLFFAFRAVELRFGSSPTWPIIASLGALALFAFVQLSRFYLVACHKPEVAMDGLSTTLEARLGDALKGFNAAPESPFGLRLAAGTQRSGEPILIALKVAVGMAVVVGILFRVDLQMRSIDGLSYNLLALALHLLVIGLLLLTCVHIGLLWLSLQSFLTSLSMLPLAGSFKPVDPPSTYLHKSE